MQTKHGNVKTPNYNIVSDWVLKWIGSKSSREISKVFDVSRFIPVDEFQLEELHYELNFAFQLIFFKQMSYSCFLTYNRFKFKKTQKRWRPLHQ